MNKYTVYYDPDVIDEEFDKSPFSLRKDIRHINEDEINSIVEEIANELYIGIDRPPNTILKYINKKRSVAYVKIKVLDIKRGAGKSNGYRCIVLVDIDNNRAFLLHLYRHGHGEDRNISKKEENELKKLVEEYTTALNG